MIFGTPPIITNGLVLYLDAGSRMSYPGSGTTWNDLSGNRNSGSLVNGPTYSSADQGSIVFDGTNDYSRIDNFSSDSNLALTIICWVYPTSLTGQIFNDVNLNWIINKRDLDNASNTWQLSSGNSIPTFNMGDSSGNFISTVSTTQRSQSAAQLTLNRWHCIAVSTDGFSSFTTYLNNSVNFQGTLSGTRGIQTKPIDIGKAGWSDSFYWNGRMSLIQIYNRALSASEISQNFNATRTRFGI